MQQSSLKRMWNYVGKYKGSLIVVGICAILGNALLIFGPFLTGVGIDKIKGKGNVDFSGLARVIVGLLVIYLFSSLFQWMTSILSNIVANKTVYDLRKEAFAKLSTLPLKYFDQTAHGEVISKLTNDLDAISDGIVQGITQIMSATLIVLGSLIFMFIISPVIALVVVLTTPFCFFIAAFIAKRSKKMFAKQSQTVGELNGYVEEMVGNLKVVKAFGKEDKILEEFKVINNCLYGWGQKAQWYSSMTNPTTRLINNIGYILVAIIGGMMAISGQLSVGKIASFLTYSNQFAKPINEITSFSSQIQSAFASADRIFALFDENTEAAPIDATKMPQAAEGKVVFDQVSFSYRQDIPLIKNLNLKVEKGNMVAIVGPTGCGKTTLVNLIMRFYEVDSGHIYIDDSDICGVTRESLRKSIGMVLQDSWLFAGTIAENIAYGKEEATREEIIMAAKEARADYFISHLPQGYDTIIDEDGRNLSQGQKQLLTIARVMIMNPPMLILDEATSSIDTRTEINIQKAFSKMMRGKTSFVIAHRLSTIREADRILVLKDGDVIEQGKHEELLGNKGFYYTLYHSQFTSSN